MKIYFITPKLDFVNSGGSTVEYDVMYRELQKLGQEVFVVTTSPARNKIPFDPPYKVITDESIPLTGFISIQKKVYDVLKKYSQDADVFHIDGQVYLYGSGLYRLMGGKVPVFAYFNRELTSWPDNISPFLQQPQKSFIQKAKKNLRWLMERYIGIPMANHIDYFAITNPYLLDAYKKFGFKDKDKSLIIGDPYDYKKTMRENGITKDSYTQRNKKDGKIIIYSSGRMVPGKGCDLLITALSKIKNKENIHLILGGSGPEEPSIRKMIADLHLEPYVELPGWVAKDQVYRNYKQADIFIMPRWRAELISLIIVEAMSFGLPIIVPSGGGLKWVADRASLDFQNDNPDDLAKKIEMLANDPQLREKLSRNCYERLEDDQINYEKNMSKVLQIMKQLVK